MTMSYIYGSLITASGELRVFNLIITLGIFVNWSLNLYLIPKTGAKGAAIATLITQSLIFCGQFILARNKFKLRFPLVFTTKLLVYVTCSFGIVHVFHELIEWPWLIEAISAGLFLVLSSFIIGFFRLSFADEN